MTPLLVLMFGIHPSVAVGTDLLYAAITKAGGTLAHGLKGTVDWKITRLLATGSIPAAAITLALIGHFAPAASRRGPPDPGLARRRLGADRGGADLPQAHPGLCRDALGRPPADPARTARLTVLTGAVLGVLVSISSVGAGALGVTALFFLYPAMPALRIVGSDIAHAVTADRGRRHRPLVSRQRRLAAAGQPAGRFAARHLARQPHFHQGTRPRPAPDPGDDAGAGRRC